MIYYALDSDTISYMLKGDREVREKFEKMAESGNCFVIPPLVYYEVKRWLVLKKANVQLRAFTKLYQDSIKGEMILEIWEKAIEIYVRLISRGTPIGKDGKETDIFTAAFCIVNDYVLVTNNTKHFQNITELKTDNWKN
jgi:predicted nucleic acid-binding protein